ncbi:hypothetical protein [uncultured Clostridium sp.]|uniref:hypothetical protein n=1 Tax=uncultured Clostridium sp. TaxID=59620 RepID=UPI0025F22F3F|nr:hypothetical protein [uncultured Clostridium sp.]
MSKFAEDMYIGEGKRDASSKVRGFIYQDLLAVEQLIDSDDSTLELYSEWAEDIYCESEKEIIITQVKYYPKSKINFKEIYTELFYQYLRLQLLECNKTITCKLSCYLNPQMNIEDISEHISNYIHITSDNDFCNMNNEKKYTLFKEVCNINSKEEREKELLSKAANDMLLATFVENYKFDSRCENLSDLRDNLKKKILGLLNNNMIDSSNWNEEILADICLALAIDYIQEAYYEADADSKLRKRTKLELVDKFTKFINEVNEVKSIIALVRYYVDECLIDYILEDISLEDTDNKDIVEIRKFYENLALSTKLFFNKFLEKDKGQYALLNTISKNKLKDMNFDLYKQKSYRDKSNIFREHKSYFLSFLKNTWKVLYDIDCNQFDKFIKKDFYEFIQFNFPQQEKIVITSAIGEDNPKKDIGNIFFRYKKLNIKPYKWLCRNSKNMRGKKNYTLEVNHIYEELEYNMAHINDDMFEIECMRCIKIEDFVAIKDNCHECIFAKKCFKKGS